MFHRKKNTVKSLACGLQEKYLRIRHNFGSKFLGEEAIQKFKYIASYAAGGSKQLVKIKAKKNIHMRLVAYMGGKELISLFNIVSKSKP